MEFSLGLVEVSSLGHAIMMLDEMLKVADVEFVSTERKLGGRLVTVVVKGSISSVTASVEAGRAFAQKLDALKAAEVIARPHVEILKFINLDEDGNIIPPKPDKEAQKQQEKVTEKAQEEKSVATKATKKTSVTPAKKAEPKKAANKPAAKSGAVKKPTTSKTAKKTTKSTTKGTTKKTK